MYLVQYMPTIGYWLMDKVLSLSLMILKTIFTFFYSSTKGSISYMRDISILKLDYELRFLNYAPYINLTLHETFWKSIYRLGGSE